MIAPVTVCREEMRSSAFASAGELFGSISDASAACVDALAVFNACNSARNSRHSRKISPGRISSSLRVSPYCPEPYCLEMASSRSSISLTLIAAAEL